ncbi:MAG: AMP-binding protein, partial [Gammaproteobacteria bacterium]|nr:AMP-binding protein [Gammaproteobacteria bacterium]
MQKIWLNSYPPATPAEIDPSSVVTLVEMFEAAVREYGEQPAFANLGASLSFARLDELSDRFAAYLQHHTDLVPGDRMALMMPNLLQYPVALFGALKAGLTVVNVNPLYTARELRHQLRDSGARGIVIVENFAHVLQEVRAETPLQTVITTRIGDLLPWPKRLLVDLVVKHVKKQVPPFALDGAVGFAEVMRRCSGRKPERVDVGLDDVAFLQYTGGTTGLAKGAMLTHGNIASNVVQASTWLGPYLERGSETIITALPLYHIFALTANCLTYLRSGGLNVLITNPRDLPALIKELSRYRFTAITGV